MNLFKILPGSRREPPGLERVILRKLPVIALAGLLIPVFFAIASHLFPPAGTEAEVAAHLRLITVLAIATVVTHLTAVFTVAIGCFIVFVMKGPAYVADRYDLVESDDGPGADRKPLQ